MGNNNLEQQIKGDKYSVANSISSSGELSASTSSSASSNNADLNQLVSGSGQASLDVKCTQGSAEAGQEASVDYGALSSSQSLSAGAGVSATQNTEIQGLTGQVGMGAFSQDKALLATGSFLGAGTLSANLKSESKGTANAEASVSVDGTQWLQDGDLKDVYSTSTGMSEEGLRTDQMGNLGTFSMQAVGMNRADYDAEYGQKPAASEAESALPDASTGNSATSSSVNYLNNPNAYVLTGWKWVTTDPQITLYLKTDTLPSYLDPTATKNAIAAAANTWGGVVGQKLFATGDALVTPSTTVQANVADGKNVHAWASISGGLAVTTTRYYTSKVNGYYPVYDSDTLYNTNYHWANDGDSQNIDVQAVATHELGHTIGLDDLYNKPQFASETDEIMNAYYGPRHSLGPGDIAGAQKLYSAFIPTGEAFEKLIDRNYYILLILY